VGTLVRDCRWHCGAKPHLQSRNSDTNVRALGTNSGAPTAPVVKQAVTSCFHVEGLRREPCQHSGPVYGKARLTITAVHHLATTRGLRLPSECLLPRFPPHLGAQKPVRKPRLTYRLIPVVVLMPVLGVVSSLGYLARLWPLLKLGSRSQVPVFVLYNLWEKEPGDLVPPRIHVACPPARGQEGSGRVHGRVPLVG